MLSLKIFPDIVQSPVIKKMVFERLTRKDVKIGVELADYSGTGVGSQLRDELANLADDQVSWHSNWKLCDLDQLCADVPQAWAAVNADIRSMRQVRATKMVIHTGLTPGKPLPPAAEYANKHYPILCHLAAQGITPYVENTAEDLKWLKEYFEELQSLGSSNRVGFCMDIGYVRVFGNANLRDAAAMQDELHALGIPLHVHIHANNGKIVNHIPLYRAKDSGILNPDELFAPMGFYHWLDERLTRYPEVAFVLEVAIQDGLHDLKEAESYLEGFWASKR